ncbi:hypothetical protein GGR52DRAFT_545108 [Hypoxylon sp. FL1284]|nr:hypothetical protein GGR52DRAFT_545108 [Hypoxylon sp. FL1284]
MSGDKMTQAQRRSIELSALPRLSVPTTANATIPDSNSATQPHALTVDFGYSKGEAVSPCSDVSPSSRCSVVSLSPSLFPLPPTVQTPATSTHSIKLPDSPPGTSRSQSSLNSWFSPPSPPPSAPLPPTPAQKRLASLIASRDGLEEGLPTPPASARVRSTSRDSDPALPPLDAPATPPRRSAARVVDSWGNRESAVDPDAPLSPPPPPPYCSPGQRTPERLSGHASLASGRVDSTTPMMQGRTVESYYDEEGFRSPSGARKGGWKSRWEDPEAGWRRPEPEGRRRRRWRKRRILTVVGAAVTALLVVAVGVTVGVYLAVAGP